MEDSHHSAVLLLFFFNVFICSSVHLMLAQRKLITYHGREADTVIAALLVMLATWGMAADLQPPLLASAQQYNDPAWQY